MPKRQRIKVKRGRGRRGLFFGRFTDVRTAERYDTFGLSLILKSGKVSKVKPKIKRKKK